MIVLCVTLCNSFVWKIYCESDEKTFIKFIKCSNTFCFIVYQIKYFRNAIQFIKIQLFSKLLPLEYCTLVTLINVNGINIISDGYFQHFFYLLPEIFIKPNIALNLFLNNSELRLNS